MSNYVLWSNTAGTNHCSLTDFKGMEKTFPLVAGRSLQRTFPDDASFAMDPSDRKNAALADSLSNTNRVIVASPRMAAFIEQQEIPGVELLPVTIFDHDGDEIDERYSIVHPVDPIDCLDLTDVEVKYSRILKDQISRLDRLALDESRIPAGRKLFRCLSFYKEILVHRELAQALLGEGFSGLDFVELPDYSG